MKFQKVRRENVARFPSNTSKRMICLELSDPNSQSSGGPLATSHNNWLCWVIVELFGDIPAMIIGCCHHSLPLLPAWPSGSFPHLHYLYPVLSGDALLMAACVSGRLRRLEWLTSCCLWWSLLLFFVYSVQTCSLIWTFFRIFEHIPTDHPHHIFDKLMADTKTNNTYLVILVPTKQYDHCHSVSKKNTVWISWSLALAAIINQY